jgi:single-strand DNA-binding protein
MQLIGLARLGRDAEARTVGDNVVANLSLAFDYYDPKAEKKRSTTWVDAALWGKQATSLEQYLLKGTQVCCTIDDLHMETYQGRNGEGVKLTGRVSSIKLAGGRSEQGGSGGAPAPAPAPRPSAAPAPRPAPAPAPASGFNDMDDDIPF